MSGLSEMQNTIGSIISIIVFYVVGGVAVAQLESADLIPSTSALNGTIGTTTELYTLVGGLLTLVVVVALLAVVIRNVRGMNGGSSD